jgi:hypothetical protein
MEKKVASRHNHRRTGDYFLTLCGEKTISDLLGERALRVDTIELPRGVGSKGKTVFPRAGLVQ